MSDYTVMDPQCRVTVEVETAVGGIVLRTLQVRDASGTTVRVPLTTEMLREMGYHCALWYRQATGRDTLMPQGFSHPVPTPSLPPPPRPRVRVRPTP